MDGDFAVACTCSGPALFSEDGYSVSIITGRDRLLEAYRLRHEVYCRELGWVEDKGDGIERDPFDEWAVPFGVYDESGALSAYIRLILPHGRFMLEDVFRPLLGPEPVVRKSRDTAEVSRLCVAPCGNEKAGDRARRRDLVLLLFRGLAVWCGQSGVRFLYAVAAEKLFRYYRWRGLPFRTMGEPVLMPDGVMARVAVLDWREHGEAGRHARQAG